MAKDKTPVTPAIRALRSAKVDFKPHHYPYEPKGGTPVTAREMGIDEHQIVKTLIMETEKKAPLVVLMHGDLQVSTKNLARTIGSKLVRPCEPQVAQKHSGYLVGGTSPFGTKCSMPIYMQASIATLEKLYINGGKRGFIVSMHPSDLIRVLDPTPVDVAAEKDR